MIKITIEGPDMSGKSTLAESIKKDLTLKGKHVILIDDAIELDSGCDVLILVRAKK